MRSLDLLCICAEGFGTMIFCALRIKECTVASSINFALGNTVRKLRVYFQNGEFFCKHSTTYIHSHRPTECMCLSDVTDVFLHPFQRFC